jgi:hypothetical protein
MSTLYQMLHGGFTPPEGASIRRHNPDKRMGNGVPIPEKAKGYKPPTAEKMAWFLEFNRLRHLKQGEENKGRVLAALTENPGVTTRQMAVVLQASVSMANSHLQKLVGEGSAYKARRALPKGGYEMLYFPTIK